MGQRTGHTVVQYLYVHKPGESYSYPTSRSSGGPAGVAMRYLECAAVQAASLRLREPKVDIVLVTNLQDLHDPAAVTHRGVRLIKAMESMGTRMIYADYEHRNRATSYASSRYLLDAINAVVNDVTDPSHQFWFTDVDVVWVDPEKVFAAIPPAGQIACIYIPYPPDWDIEGTTPQRLGDFGRELGECPSPIPWVGGELIAGTAEDLRNLVTECDALDELVASRDGEIPAEEHVLSLAGGLGRASFVDREAVAWRVLTGPRNEAEPHPNPGALGLWHLPSEKGLGFRRTATALITGRQERVRRDFADVNRAMKRFNVRGAGGLTRRVRDDSWLAVRKLRQMFA